MNSSGGTGDRVGQHSLVPMPGGALRGLGRPCRSLRSRALGTTISELGRKDGSVCQCVSPTRQVW